MSSSVQFTEQDIRRLAIGRLRIYYKLRPRRDWNGIQIVDKPHRFQNITIDARLTYIEPEGQSFIATVEASSLNKRKELDYRFNWFRWLGESACLTAFVLANILGLLFLWGVLELDLLASITGQQEGLLAPEGALSHILHYLGNLMILLFGDPEMSEAYENIGGGFNLFHNPVVLGSYWVLLKIVLFAWSLVALLLLLFPKRYRYIYAIEQFKRFYANDQWIAFSHELYQVHTDPRFVELQRQSARYGFGMMELQADRSFRIIMAPKRGDYFSGIRTALPNWLLTLEKSVSRTKLLPQAKEPLVLPPEIDPLSPQLLQFEAASSPSATEEEVPFLPPIVARQTASPGRPSFKSHRLAFLRRRWWHLRWRIRHFLRPAVVKNAPGFYHFSRYWLSMGLVGIFVCTLIVTQHAQETTEAALGDQDAVHLPGRQRMEVNPANYEPLDPAYEARLNDITIGPDGQKIRENALRPESQFPATPYTLENQLAVAPQRQSSSLDPALAGYDSDIFHYRIEASDTSILFNCLSLSNTEAVYLLLYEVTNNFEQALGIAWRLHEQTKVVVNISRSDCFNAKAPGYIVFLGDPMVEESLVNYYYRTYTRDYGISLEVFAPER